MENVARAIRIAYEVGGIEEFAGHEEHHDERAHPLGVTPLWKVGFEDCEGVPNRYGGCGSQIGGLGDDARRTSSRVGHPGIGELGKKRAFQVRVARTELYEPLRDGTRFEDDGGQRACRVRGEARRRAPKCPIVWVLRAIRRTAWKSTWVVSVGAGHVRATRGRRSRRKRNVLKTHARLVSRAAKTATCVPFRTMRPADTTRCF
ncbi:hypothetical protein TNCT_598551 [Trichonephila clavata]|uniref:Uncharacterized protein n=1 Tax=Trichonephila clavata TaxID=2740835 RepID=A0A8X6FHT4_TRICU|nr:hypothetical protein TNCT_598551 [Trichonephila clavata]